MFFLSNILTQLRPIKLSFNSFAVASYPSPLNSFRPLLNPYCGVAFDDSNSKASFSIFSAACSYLILLLSSSLIIAPITFELLFQHGPSSPSLDISYLILGFVATSGSISSMSSSLLSSP